MTPPNSSSDQSADKTGASDQRLRDWPESREYMGTCHTCHLSFFGPKWRIQGRACRKCAEVRDAQAVPTPTPGESQAPRCDAAVEYLPGGRDGEPTPYVPIHIAAGLERELQEARVDSENWRKAFDLENSRHVATLQRIAELESLHQAQVDLTAHELHRNDRLEQDLTAARSALSEARAEIVFRTSLSASRENGGQEA